MVPVAAVLLAHVPPVAGLVRVVVCPAHTLSMPPIAPGRALTVTTAVAEQPDIV